MSVSEAPHRVSHAVRRVAQTPRSFTNWPAVLRDIARGSIGRGPQALTITTRNGQQISCPNRPGARVPIYEIFAEDCYRLRWFLGPLCDEPLQVIDIGGHVGTFACELARVHPAASIQSFEPSRHTSQYLQRNVDQNGLTGRIEVFQQAVAGSPGWAEFDDNGAGSGMNGLVRARDHVLATVEPVPVETVTFDAIVAAAPAPVGLVKIDCEGGEYELVYASSAASWSTVQRLVLEYHEVPGQSGEELLAWFAGVGLDVVRREAATDHLGTAWLSRTPIADR
jgi:FkbM family methyltransferase